MGDRLIDRKLPYNNNDSIASWILDTLWYPVQNGFYGKHIILYVFWQKSIKNIVKQFLGLLSPQNWKILS